MSQEFSQRTDGPLGFQANELLCPHDQARLIRAEVSEMLVCPGCERVYPVVYGSGSAYDGRPGVPVLISEDLAADQQETVDAFSAKWDFSPEAVREERARVATRWFLKRFAASAPGTQAVWVNPQGKHRELPQLLDLALLLQNKHRILEVGCGLGHLVTLMAQHAPHAEVWGVDLSSAIFKINAEGLPNLRLVQADLRDVPIAGRFDLILADGVLHHTPDTFASASALANRLAPGGDFLFHLYKQKAPLRELADELIRQAMSRMNDAEAWALCALLTSLGRQLREAQVTIRLDQDLTALGIPAGEHDLQRLIYWHFLKCFWDDGGNAAASIVENYDWYRPKLAWRHTRAEVEAWVSSCPEVRLLHLGEDESGFSVHAQKEQG